MRILLFSLFLLSFSAVAHAEEVQMLAKKDGSFWSRMLSSEKTEQAKEETQTPISDLTITVFAPESTGKFQTAKTRVILEGSIDKAEKVTNIRVNGYVLKKYKAGDTKFSYIASTKMKTMKRGENVYTIEALDAEGKVLSTAQYTIVSDPKFTTLAHTGANTMLFAFILAGAGAWAVQRRMSF